MAMPVLYAYEARSADHDINAERTTASPYLGARITTRTVFVAFSFASYQHRIQARLLSEFLFIKLRLSVSVPAKATLVAVIVVYQETTWVVSLSHEIKRLLKLKNRTAVDIPPEIDGDPTNIGLTSSYGKAVCGLVIAFCTNLI
ncbi:hypothetical protein E4U42_003769 [Claviceps africana]|uniref:Uncharacterized protein n=1 Tax=Claviceps africana TaxID=83212 RepID=A0A8K0JCT8_9HYPO|nr:hypothetical protein E4U42_003769 [Claviceps africana]